MSQQGSRLLQEALALPDTERGDLALRLIETLDPGVDQDVEGSWDAEIARRLIELEHGKVQAVPWPEARRMILDEVDDADLA